MKYFLEDLHFSLLDSAAVLKGGRQVEPVPHLENMSKE